MNPRLLQHAPLALSIWLAPYACNHNFGAAHSSAPEIATTPRAVGPVEPIPPSNDADRSGNAIHLIGADASLAPMAAPGGRVGVIVHAGNRATLGSPDPKNHAEQLRPSRSYEGGSGELQSDALLLARACWVESGWALKDCAAIAYVIKRRARRAEWTFARMLVKYSALDADTPRAAFARQLPAGDEPTWNAASNERWALLRAIARAALDGRVRSPAPRAVHWGSRTISNDVRRAKRAVDAGRWRAVPSQTLNVFFAEVPR